MAHRRRTTHAICGPPRACSACPTGSIPTTRSTSARSSVSSTAAPGITSRWKPRSRTRATSSAPMSARRRVVVARGQDGAIHVFENRCAHRAAEFCRELTGNTKEFVCPYHQWTYELTGALRAVPFRRGVAGKGGMPTDFDMTAHGLDAAARHHASRRRLRLLRPGHGTAGRLSRPRNPARVRGDVRRPPACTILGHYRHSLPGNWKLYHENLKDPYHATLLHTFLVTFGLLVAGNKSLMLADATGRHGVMASAEVRRRQGRRRAARRNALLQGRHDAGRTALHGRSSTNSTAPGR